MRGTLLSAVLVLLATGVLRGQGQIGPRDADLNRRGSGVERLHVWVESVRRHQPGLIDETTDRVRQWSPAELDNLWIELQTLHKLMEDPRSTTFYTVVQTTRGHIDVRVIYTGSELDRLRRLALSLGGRDPRAPVTPESDRRVVAARNTLLKRGVVMHTSIALTHPREVQTTPVNPLAPTRNATLLFADGRQIGIDRAADHWRFSRTLLNRVLPTPGSDSGVRIWYRASSAAHLRDQQLRSDHFGEAVRLFPDDAVLLMLNGGLRETFASTGLQVFLKSAAIPADIRLTVGPARTELGRAELQFRKALNSDSNLIEARLRLGRVLSLQERHADALAELRHVNQSAPALLQYYASLFTGGAAEALGRRDEARAAYEHAASLYPRAQAPQFALSQLSASAGQLPVATDTLDRMLSRPSAPSTDDDPYWTYYESIGRDADTLLVEAIDLLTREERP